MYFLWNRVLLAANFPIHLGSTVATRKERTAGKKYRERRKRSQYGSHALSGACSVIFCDLVAVGSLLLQKRYREQPRLIVLNFSTPCVAWLRVVSSSADWLPYFPTAPPLQPISLRVCCICFVPSLSIPCLEAISLDVFVVHAWCQIVCAPCRYCFRGGECFDRPGDGIEGAPEDGPAILSGSFASTTAGRLSTCSIAFLCLRVWLFLQWFWGQ